MMQEKDSSFEALKEKVDPVKLKAASESSPMQVAIFDNKSHQGSAEPEHAVVDPSQPAREDPKEKFDHSKKSSHGMLKHKLTLGATAFFALTVLVVNAFDLRSLINQNGKVDRRFVFTPTDGPQPNDYREGQNNGEFREGLKPISQFSLGEKKFGFVNLKGDMVIAPNFQRAKNFSDGLAAVKMPGNKGKWGFISPSGQLVVPAIYSSVNSFHKGFAYVREDVTSKLIDKSGKDCAPENIRDFRIIGDGYYLFRNKQGLEWGLGKGREVLLPPQYTDLATLPYAPAYESFASELNGFGDDAREELSAGKQFYFAVRNKNSCGLVDRNGKLCFAGDFDYIKSVNKNHALVIKSGQAGFVDMTGKYVITPAYDEVSAYDDLIAVRSGKKVSFIDSTGKAVRTVKVDNVVIDPETHKWLHDGLGIFKRGDKYGYMDIHGNEIIAPKFDHASFFENGVARVLKNSRWQAINRSGDNMGDKNYISLSRFKNDEAQVNVAGPLYRAFEEWPKELMTTKNTLSEHPMWQGAVNFESGDF